MLLPIKLFAGKKEIIRLQMAAARKAAAKTKPDAAIHAARMFLENIPFAAGDIIALYHSIKTELAAAPLADALAKKNVKLALPVVEGKKRPLVFRAYAHGDPLVDGVYGAMVPAQTALEVIPSIIVAPLLAFTRRGDRLGYGGGYYDRTLKTLRAAGEITAVGYAFGAQEVDALPVSPLDQRLDWIVTEREAIRV